MSPKKTLFNSIAFVSGTLCSVLTLVIMAVSGSPYEMLHKIYANNAIPPIWIWWLACILVSFLAGYGAGILLENLKSGKLAGDHEHSAYKGLIFYVTFFLLSNSHYPLFFVAERFFISLTITLFSIIAAALCAFFWSKPSPLSTVLISFFILWQIYVAFINVCILIKI